MASIDVLERLLEAKRRDREQLARDMESCHEAYVRTMGRLKHEASLVEAEIDAVADALTAMRSIDAT